MIYFIEGITGNRATECADTFSILKTVIRKNEGCDPPRHEAGLSPAMSITHIRYEKGEFIGEITLSDVDTLTFKGECCYRNDEVDILDISYCSEVDINELCFSPTDRFTLRSMIAGQLYEDFNHEMEMENYDWQSEQQNEY